MTKRSWTRAIATSLSLSVGFLLALAAPVAAVAPSEIVSRHGIRPVDPPTSASDFTLPSLKGEEVSLSDFHGRWVLLTFFATWCGPCRSEMPSLERLNQQLLDDGLVVVAVSVDQQQSAVAPFVERLGLTFPVLWDRGGRAGAAYRASSIPISYVIDPQGRIVGVSRGARDWAALVPMVNELFAEMPPDDQARWAYAGDDSSPVELPSTVEPPTAEVSLRDPEIIAGRPFSLEVRLLWAGHFTEYVPQPPDVHLPDGVERRQVTAASDSRDGNNVVVYTLELVAAEPGSYALDPVELRYVTLAEQETLTSRLLGPTVEVRQRTIAGLPPLTFFLAAGGLLLVAGLGYGLVRKVRSGRRRIGTSAGERYEQLRSRFDQARALRMQGDPAGFVLAMAELSAELGNEPGEDLPQVSAEWVEQARYGGQAPPPEELDRLQRQVERQLQALRPDPEKSERQAIRLAEEHDEPASGDD